MKNSSYWLVGVLAAIGGYTLGHVVAARAVARLTPEQLQALAAAKARLGTAASAAVRAGVAQ